MMAKFAERSSLEGQAKIGAPRVFKKEKAEPSLEGLEYDDDEPPPAAAAPPVAGLAAIGGLQVPAAGMDATAMAMQAQFQKAVDKEIGGPPAPPAAPHPTHAHARPCPPALLPSCPPALGRAQRAHSSCLCTRSHSHSLASHSHLTRISLASPISHASH